MLQNTISLVQLLKVYKPLAVTTDVNTRVCWCSPSNHYQQGYRLPSFYRWGGQPNVTQLVYGTVRSLPQVASRLTEFITTLSKNSFKTDTALACLFQVIFKLYKTFKSEPQNYIKEHYTRRHLSNRSLQSINPAFFCVLLITLGVLLWKKVPKNIIIQML